MADLGLGDLLHRHPQGSAGSLTGTVVLAN